ncbi:MAG: glucose-1-phosphate adenylyltransferase [Acidimicrobiales bacterium]|nr:glucose-1-phosphate adenylyltransferase [Acidimicrobiales bacterium]
MFDLGVRPRVLSIVLAGGEGKRLMPLTEDRAKPAVPFGGPYRLIDFALSNLVNGGYRKIVVLTQYKSHSLDVHVSRTWRLSTFLGNYVSSVPAQMRRGPEWFQGSADALFQNINLIDDEKPEYIFVFGADHIYRMDPRQMLDQHIRSGAGVTVAALRVSRAEADQFGVIDKDESSNGIKRFLEKPTDPPGLPDDPDRVLASMGNYVFDASVLVEALNADAAEPGSGRDMGGDIIPRLVADGAAEVYDYTQNVVPGDGDAQRGYWRDVGTLDAYFDAHMDLVQPLPAFSLYNQQWPIFTLGRSLPPAKLVRDGVRSPDVSNSVIANGAILSGCTAFESVISPNVRVERDATIEGTVIFDDVTIGARSQIRRAIIDKNVVVPPGTRIGFNPEEDRARFTVSDGGVVAVPKNYEF